MSNEFNLKNHITVNIIGAGLAGLSAAIHLAEAGVSSRLVSRQPSERAQSVLAAGGINGALNTMGEDDEWQNHFKDTMKAGCDIADPEAVRNLTENAPDIIRWLDSLGVPFQRKGDVIQQRNFGGQKKKRTAYSRSSTGKVLMTALIDEARKYEAAGMITRYSRHDFVRLMLAEECSEADSSEAVNRRADFDSDEKAGFAAQQKADFSAQQKQDFPDYQKADRVGESRRCLGVTIRDRVTGEVMEFDGPVLMACGGLNGLFPGKTTGTTANTADAAAALFAQGVAFSNLEMIQYHPTTLGIPDKRLLVSEAARGEGGRLFIMRGGEKWYFMEEKYPELGNLMPRDVVSREEYFVMHDAACGGQVYLDCTGLSSEIWKRRLPDLRKEVIYYTKKDPVKEPIAIEPGIHYFMGGIDTDALHRTNISGLYAAGECCSLYHGANRLGGNSMLGAVYGGKRAAQTITGELEQYEHAGIRAGNAPMDPEGAVSAAAAAGRDVKVPVGDVESAAGHPASEQNEPGRDQLLGNTLYAALGVARDEKTMTEGLHKVRGMLPNADSDRERARITLGIAILESALFRKESRGAQYRSDYPDRDPAYRGTVVAECDSSGRVNIFLRKA